MHGDFTRSGFIPARRYSAVLQQQGRVQLDADWNTLVAIVSDQLRGALADVIGWHGTPTEETEDAFLVEPDADREDFTIGPGRYYVDGIVCHNPAADGEPVTFRTQPDHAPGDAERDWVKSPNPATLIYLDVWERFVTGIQDPRLLDDALGGADTTGRARVVWQVKAARVQLGSEGGCPDPQTRAELLAALGVQASGTLAARLQPVPDLGDPCEVSPESRYRGLENQLYRVEIRDPGDASDATFMWSRNNGSEVFAVRDRRGDGLVVEGVGRDQVADLKEGDWVEVLDDGLVLAGEPGDLRKVSEVDPLDGVVLLDGPVAFDSARHPFVRRWDSDGAVDVAAGAKFPDGWIPLEDGVEVKFTEGWFRTGDYWQVPVRTSGRLEWPPDPDGPSSVPPSGIMHHYAPLACLTDGASPADRRRKFARLQP